LTTTFQKVGDGWCVTEGKQHLPALYGGPDLSKQELVDLCSSFTGCVGFDIGNSETAILRFDSIDNLADVTADGWLKWAEDCQTGCMIADVTNGGREAEGECYEAVRVAQ